METVLAVSDIDFDPALVTDVSQLSAEEFLLYVRYEAEQCPDVVRAPVDSTLFEGCQTEYMPKVKDIPTCHEMFLPSMEWENEVVETFSRFRQYLDKMSKDLSTRERKYVVPSMKDEASWFGFCLGGSLAEADGSAEMEAANRAKIADTINGDVDLRKNMLLASLVEVEVETEPPTSTAMELNENEEDGELKEETDKKEGEKEPAVVEYLSRVPPSNQLLLQFDQVLTQRLLGFFASWIQLPALKIWNICDNSGEDEEGEVINQYGGEFAYSWIFSLLSRLEKPLYMDASATVRDLYRHLCIQRVELADRALAVAGIAASQGSGCLGPSKRTRESSTCTVSDIAELPESTQKSLAVLNTVIVICGKYFGQQEADDIPILEAMNEEKNVKDDNNEEINNEEEQKLENGDRVDEDNRRREEIKEYFASMAAKYPTLVRDDELYNGSMNQMRNFSGVPPTSSGLGPGADIGAHTTSMYKLDAGDEDY
eukprot:CAMPEP_0114451594 /NCGR_PEP_ID=MMETSP0104-20121206/1066_1 /TAXON_ID=37642 ORGANISM="Paraphysomonas imperforata, Strain PA2" /NCGR_SAMPLE_ID=MMETSP0104 /ASSEMBLY_ACC=CAM_ASM_000202 /LENGTH=483 /DNA_ID=CAMNT_0001623791 /DNA_START=1 /DNA_END=1452 /DNA_ORIENTATION=+